MEEDTKIAAVMPLATAAMAAGVAMALAVIGAIGVVKSGRSSS